MFQRSTLLRALSILALAYALVVGLFAAVQTRLIFPAPARSTAELHEEALALGAQEIQLRTADGVTLYGWELGGGPHLALVFTGNGDSVGASHRERYRALGSAGFRAIHVNYRGYPGSGGSPSESGLLDDARAMWAYALTLAPPSEIALVGTSLGGGVAVALAAEVQPRALVVESTFTSIRDVAGLHYPWLPVSFLLTSPFDSAARAPTVRCRSLVVHGDRDGLIPVDQGRRLASLLPNGQFIEVQSSLHGEALLERPDVWPRVRAVLGAP